MTGNSNTAWLDLVNLHESNEHLNLCNAALMEIQQTERARTLRFVADALSVMAAFKIPTMDTVDVMMVARDRVTADPSVSLKDALKDAQESLGYPI